MLIGVPREIKVHEYRVGLTPESAHALRLRGHEVLVETGAGAAAGAADDDYRAAGARVAAGAAEVFERAELIVKVKEPLAAERARLRRGQALFTYLHLAPDAAQTRELAASGAIAIAYETVSSPDGRLPLLAPMSEVAGRMAVQVAAHYLERPQGGRGVLFSGASGVAAARLLVLGGGVVGSNAARLARAMGAEVTLLGRGEATPERITRELGGADAVVGAALVPGGLAPKLVTRAMLKALRPGAVLIDVSIDQGGCFETSRVTTHADPVFVLEGIVHYCVANMPGAVPRTSTYALNHATLPYVIALADRGVEAALRADSFLRDGLNVCRGAITRREVAQALGLPFTEALAALGGG